jgi:cytochrome c oxidase cbb3-type subunit 1
LIEWHFWLALSGTLIYVFAMWNSGIIQGLMWRTYTEEDTLAYSFVDSLKAMWPYYVARAFGGLLFLTGAIIGLYNILMTIRSPDRVESRDDVPDPADLALAGE